MNYEEEWDDDDDEREDIGGIWQVVRGKKATRKEHRQAYTDKNHGKRYGNRWEALEEK